jgi:TolB-like protein/tetratricopeptide (TPR) repeat protein
MTIPRTLGGDMAETGGEAKTSGGAPAPPDASAGTSVFISYASQDAAVAGALVEALERHGVGCWIAPRDVKAGALYADAIVRAISGAKAIVLVLSESAIASSHVGKEIERASSKKRPIIALRIDAAPLTPALEYFLSESQWVEAQTGSMEAAYAKLIDAIRDPARAAPESLVAVAPGRSAGTASAAHPKSRRNRILFAAGLAVVAVTLASLLANKFWLAKHIASEQPTTAAMNVVSEKSIAVLPFTDMSEKKDQEYFGDGMAEELIDRLAQVAELRVISRTSAFQFKGKSEDVRSIGSKLSVGSILEGSVRRSGNRLRIAVQLVNASDGAHRWSQSYDRNAKDVFTVQDEIANEVVQALKIRLIGTLSRERAPTENMSAHNLLLEGRFFQERWAAGDSERAVVSYERALKEDPSYALAWAELSWALLWQRTSGGNYERAVRAATKAVELRPDLAQAHATWGWCESLRGYNWALADAEFNKALALEPQNMRAIYGKGRLARVLRRNDDSLRYYHAALERDPVNAFATQGLSTTLVANGQAAEAVQYARRALDISPSIQEGHFYLGYALFWNGELENAMREMRLEGLGAEHFAGIALIEHARSQPAAADAALRELLAIEGGGKAYRVAAVYAMRGDAKSAVAWLERARTVRENWLAEVTTDPAFKAIRGDPEVVAFMRKMKLPE